MSLFLLATRTKDVVVVAESVSPIVYTSPAQAFYLFFWGANLLRKYKYRQKSE